MPCLDLGDVRVGSYFEVHLHGIINPALSFRLLVL